MYNRNLSDSLNQSSDIMDYIEDYDVFNSSYIHELDKSFEFELYSINKLSKRLDLISSEINKSYDNYGLIGITNRITSDDDIKSGSVIKIFRSNTLIDILGRSRNVSGK